MKSIYTLIFAIITVCNFAQTKQDSVQKQIKSPQDVIKTSFDNTAFEKKGLITVDTKQLNKFKNREVITSAKVFNSHFKNADLLLNAGTNWPKVDFKIIIKAKDLPSFDHPDSHCPGNWIMVTGKAIAYDGKSAIVIEKENQIKVVRK